MSCDEFIKNLKVGDPVVISNRFGMSLHKVERITPSGRIYAGGMIFNSGGVERGGGSWVKSILREATPKLIEVINQNETIREAFRLMNSKRTISYEQAKKIIEILGADNEQRAD